MDLRPVMCFLLPKTLCKQIASLIAEFWWKNSKDKRGIHWKEWKQMSKEKHKGGLGFKDIEAYNIALLGKQMWRILTRKESLLSRVFKARYFHNSNPLNATLGSRSSYAWRSIFQAQNMIKQGARICIGDGKETSIWNDQWIGSKPARPARAVLNQPRSQQPYVSSLYKVSEFLDKSGREWNQALITDILGEEEYNRIRHIRPGGAHSEDIYCWEYIKNDHYTVKSGYWTYMKLIKEKDELTVLSQPSLDPLYQIVWQTDTSPKIRHFMWRCLSNCLPVAGNMKLRQILKDGSCGRCSAEMETVNHLLFTCPYARLVWALSSFPAPPNIDLEDSFFENFCRVMTSTPYHPHEANVGMLSPWIMWRIWKNRNNFLINNVDFDALETVNKAQEDMEEWLGSKEDITEHEAMKQKEASTTKWNPPLYGWFKCNVDRAWSADREHCGIGWILQDHLGKAIWIGAKKCPKLRSPLETEAEAFRWAILCLQRLNYKQVILETNSKTLINVISKSEEWPTLQPYVMDIHHLKETIGDLKFEFTFKNGNILADKIAKESYSFENCVPKLYSIMPSWLNPWIEEDKL